MINQIFLFKERNHFVFVKLYVYYLFDWFIFTKMNQKWVFNLAKAEPFRFLEFMVTRLCKDRIYGYINFKQYHIYFIELIIHIKFNANNILFNHVFILFFDFLLIRIMDWVNEGVTDLKSIMSYQYSLMNVRNVHIANQKRATHVTYSI